MTADPRLDDPAWVESPEGQREIERYVREERRRRAMERRKPRRQAAQSGKEA